MKYVVLTELIYMHYYLQFTFIKEEKAPQGTHGSFDLNRK